VRAIAPLNPSTRRAHRERLLARIPEDWRAPLRDAIQDESYGPLADFLADERSLPDTEIYPPQSQGHDRAVLEKPPRRRLPIIRVVPIRSRTEET
jgi:hypothetical protein